MNLNDFPNICLLYVLLFSSALGRFISCLDARKKKTIRNFNLEYKIK